MSLLKQTEAVDPRVDPIVVAAQRTRAAAVRAHEDLKAREIALRRDLEGDQLARMDANLEIGVTRREVLEADRARLLAEREHVEIKAKAVDAFLKAQRPRIVKRLEKVIAALKPAVQANRELLALRAEMAAICGDPSLSRNGWNDLAFAPFVESDGGASRVSVWMDYLQQEQWTS